MAWTSSARTVSVVLDSTGRARAEPAVASAGAALARRGVPAAAVTLCGAGFGLVAAAGLAAGGFAVAVCALGAASAADVLDGAVARAGRGSSAAGALLDATCDRVVDGALWAAVAVFGWRTGSPLVAVAALAVLWVSPLVPYVRARAEAAGVPASVVAVGPGGRGERLAVLVAALAGCAVWPGGARWLLGAAAVAVAVLSAASVGLRFCAAARALAEPGRHPRRVARRRSRRAGPSVSSLEQRRRSRRPHVSGPGGP